MHVLKMLSFGFKTCIKVNSPLVNRLISDSLLDAFRTVSIRRRFKSNKLVLSFRFYEEYQTDRWWDILICIFVPKIII